VRVFSANGVAELGKPRGLRFDGAGNLCCTAKGEIIAFDFASGRCIGTPVRFAACMGRRSDSSRFKSSDQKATRHSSAE